MIEVYKSVIRELRFDRTYEELKLGKVLWLPSTFSGFDRTYEELKPRLLKNMAF